MLVNAHTFAVLFTGRRRARDVVENLSGEIWADAQGLLSFTLTHCYRGRFRGKASLPRLKKPSTAQTPGPT